MNSVRGLFRFLIIPDSKKTRKPQWYSLDRIHLINNDEEELICYGKTVSGGVQGEGGKGYLQGGEGGAYLGGFGGGGGFRGDDNGAGGGGGYSGGNGGRNKAFFCGGGGVSFNIRTNQLTNVVITAMNVIKWLSHFFSEMDMATQSSKWSRYSFLKPQIWKKFFIKSLKVYANLSNFCFRVQSLN